MQQESNCTGIHLEPKGFCRTVDSGMPMSLNPQCLVCCTQQTLAQVPQRCFWFCWKPLLEAQAVPSPSPFVLYPSKVLPTCGTSPVLQSLYPSPRRRKLHPAGRCQQRWDLFLDSHPLTLVGRALLGDIHQPSKYPPGVVDSIIFPLWFTVSTFSLPGHMFFLFDLFFSSFFRLFSFSLWEMFSYGKATRNSACKQMHRDSKNIDGRVLIPNAFPVFSYAHRWMRYWCVGCVFLSVFPFHGPVLSPLHPCHSTYHGHMVSVHVKKSHLFLWMSRAYLPSQAIILK